MRITACGYDGEGYEALEKAGWSVHHWSAGGGYGARTGNTNRHRERIWFSPHCQTDRTLFDDT
jgi:hypothetical protein